jgi:hypothetical protein
MTQRTSRQTLLAAGLLATILVVAVIVLADGLRSERKAPPPVGRVPPQASADRFLDSVGVNVHVTYLDTAYQRIDAWLARLRELGVRHVRDGLVLDNDASAPRLRQLAAAGMRLTLITSLDRPADEQVRYATANVGAAVEALEAPNEVDISGAPDWAPRLRAFLPQLRAAAGARTLVGPSLVNPASWKQLSGLTGSWNVNNLHPYPGGGEPSSNLAPELGRARGIAAGRPVQATETGYHDALKAAGGQPPVSEETAAAYLPRMALAYFAAGIQRTFLYELADERPDAGLRHAEQHFGLLRADLTPKPAFVALRDLLQAVRRSDGPGQPREVRVRAPRDVRTLLLRRDDGSAALALWRSAPAWEAARRAAIPTTPARAVVGFDGRAKDVTVHRLGHGVQRRGETAEVEVPVAADVVLVTYR